MKTSFPVLYLTVVLMFLGSATGQQCVQGENCQLPHCFCPTFKHPSFPDPKDIPQMVYFGFDDAVNAQVNPFYGELFTESRRNPNGCSITMSLYVQDEWTNYNMVKDNYARGMEIAVHSVTHENVDTKEKLIFEAREQKNNLSRVAGVPLDEVVGWRSPFLQPAGDAQPDVLQSLGYTYDITYTYTRLAADNSIAFPYTLDFGYPYNCAVPPCPGSHSSHPGFWEIPINSLYNPETGYACAFVDSCRPTSEAAALQYLWKNFQRAYSGNRAPFGLNMHAAWFFTQANLKATHAFIERLLKMDDVYIISAKQVLDWMRDPVNVTEAANIPSWGCKAPQPSRAPSTSGPNTPIVVPPGASATTPAAITTQLPATKAPSTDQPAVNDSCDPLFCKLPSCQCHSYLTPGGLAPQNTPQIIYLTVSGGVNGQGHDKILQLLNSTARRNPNGCPISATFFVPVSGNVQNDIDSLRNAGNEIAMFGSESVAFDPQIGLSLEEQVKQEVNQFQTVNTTNGLTANAGSALLGYRSRATSFLGNNLFTGLSKAGVLYDSSLFLQRPTSLSTSSVIPWPYTLDYGWKEQTGCQDCPSGRYPGLWEVPLVTLVDYKRQYRCTYADSCYFRPPSAQETFKFLAQNLEHAINTNRAPMAINLRKEWFSHSFYAENLKGLEMFLDAILTHREDVYVMSIEKMLAWVRNPTSLAQVRHFTPWVC